MKWTHRDTEQAECDYTVFIASYNAIVEAERAGQAGKPISRSSMMLLQRAYATLSPLARQAIDHRLAALAAIGSLVNPATDDKPADHVPGRALATLRAFNEFGETVDD